jgi:D-sedoheptulose 7-phosphate isomerase
MSTIKDNADKTIQGLSNIDYTQIESLGKRIAKAIRDGNKLLIAGNGGSAADSQHFAGELVCKFLKERRGIPAISLNTNTSVLTAWPNDVSFDSVFSRQIEALGRKGDIFFGITTSGSSKNIVEAFRKCREMGITTILLEGNRKGDAEKFADFAIKVPLEETPRIQECHIFIIHSICEIIENEAT